MPPQFTLRHFVAPWSLIRAAGFTIIEIVLVVAVLAVVAALALPAYASHRERVRIAQAVIDIKGIESALYAYRNDNRDLPDDLAAVGYQARLDPWGQAYQYTNLTTARGNGAARKNRNLSPINSDFDLWSMGVDGQSRGPLTARQSRDDIVRANDGRFVGLASDYDP
jgi:general secretion pathway protein G